MTAHDRYGSFDYSSLINWSQRLPREWEFLGPRLAGAPSKRILDLGSGTGEHARFLAAQGLDVTGIDSSAAMVEKARSGGGTFLAGDIRDLGAVVGEERFGAAICVGNVLPHLTEEADLRRLAGGLRAVLLDGGMVILQLLNYDRIEAKKERALPLVFQPGGIVFLRTMELRDGGRVIFMPTVLRMDAEADPPMQLVASQRVEIRGWRAPEVTRAFEESGFASVERHGSYAGDPFQPGESRDLIVVAR
jgi:glycine/sarcosine N-methyltransferase